MRLTSVLSEIFWGEEKPFLAKVAVPLAGALLCLHILSDEIEPRRPSSGNANMDKILLSSCWEFKVLCHSSPGREEMFQIPLYRNEIENKHLWYHFQNVAFEETTVGVSYLEFMNAEDAVWAKERLDSYQFFPGSRLTAIALGNYAIHAHGTGKQVEECIEKVFAAITENAERGGIVHPSA